MKISLIVPIAPGDESWRALFQDLAILNEHGDLEGVEILLIVADEDKKLKSVLQTGLVHYHGHFDKKIRLVQGGNSRAVSMNRGAAAAVGEYLWFVHADSRLNSNHLQALRNSLQKYPKALHYFDLEFYGHRLMWINEGGVWIRSHLLMTPFGDQALCISQDQFDVIGAYPEGETYGEDHLLVWHALQEGIRLRCTDVSLQTSARKYQSNGWLKTTGLHLWLWAKQASPEFMVLIKRRGLGLKL